MATVVQAETVYIVEAMPRYGDYWQPIEVHHARQNAEKSMRLAAERNHAEVLRVSQWRRIDERE